MGPWLVTKDEIANPDDLDRACKVGGELDRRRQHALLQLQGRRGRELHQPVPHAARPATSSRSARRSSRASDAQVDPHTRTSRPSPAPSRSRSKVSAVQENPMLVEDKEIGAWRLQLSRARAARDPRRARGPEHGVLLSPRPRRGRRAARALHRRRLLHARPAASRSGKAELEQVFRSRSATPARARRAHLYSGLRLEIESATRARGTSVCMTFGQKRGAAVVARPFRRSRRRLSSIGTCAAMTASGAFEERHIHRIFVAPDNQDRSDKEMTRLPRSGPT